MEYGIELCQFLMIFLFTSVTSLFFLLLLFLAWAWLAKAKGRSCHTKKPTLAKTFTEKTSKSAKRACHYATKERPDKITMYLGLNIIIKLKFTIIFDRCAILNVLNYLTKNFES